MSVKNNMWPKGPTFWIEDKVLYGSIPFTYNLPEVKNNLLKGSNFLFDKVVLGGPAVCLIPDYFKDINIVSIGSSYDGILQKVNPFATRTSIGCPNKCGFCGVKKIEPLFKELDDWPDLPIICDNNLLATSKKHFDRVIGRLKNHNWCDFNQGLDSRLLTEYHAFRLAELKKPIIRLALDSMAYSESWKKAFNLLREAGLPKKSIRSYALIGFNSGPDEAWERCRWIESHGIKALPMWYHPLNALEKNIVTDDQKLLDWDNYSRIEIMENYYQRGKAHATTLKSQKELGWDEKSRVNIMGWFYKHRKKYEC